MKKVSLNIAERLYALGILNQYKGDHRTLALVLQDVVPVGFEPEERTSINLRDVKNEEGEVVSIAWDLDKVTVEEKEIEFHDEVVQYIKDKFKKMDEDGTFSIGDRAAITLIDKLS